MKRSEHHALRLQNYAPFRLVQKYKKNIPTAVFTRQTYTLTFFDSALVTQASRGGSLDPRVCSYHIFAQFLVGEECAQLCDHRLPRMFRNIELMSETNETKTNI